MDFRGIKIDFAGLAQVILGVTALLTAWRGRQIAKEKKANAERNEDDTQGT
jgi:hypothetical protein